jgi:transcriptional regulator PpsR
LGDLDAASAATLIAAAADIAVIVDGAGVIRDLAFHSDQLAAELPGAAGWIGRPFADTVAPDSRPKVEAMLREPPGEATPRWRHINHLTDAGASVPVLYSAASIGEDRRLVAFGRDLRAVAALQQRLVNAQQAMEQDYARLREMEMRYRLLFQTSADSVLIVDAARNRVGEANPAACQLLGEAGGQVVGKPLAEVFAPASRALVQAHLGAVRAGGKPDDVVARLADGVTEVAVGASLFRQESAVVFLVRLARAQASAKAAPADDVRARLLAVVDHAPDAFVMTDHDGRVLAANAAFADMAQLAGEEQARGQSLDRWLGQSALDVEVLISNVRQRGAIRFFATSLRGENGGVAQVEVSAVAVANGGQPSLGFAIRNVGPRLRTGQRIGRDLPRSVEQLSELIGRVALKDLVREATDVIERLCIEAALELTGDNRAAAAEMLGLSRQSLYVKLRRYGLGEQDSDGRD